MTCGDLEKNKCVLVPYLLHNNEDNTKKNESFFFLLNLIIENMQCTEIY